MQIHIELNLIHEIGVITVIVVMKTKVECSFTLFGFETTLRYGKFFAVDLKFTGEIFYFKARVLLQIELENIEGNLFLLALNSDNKLFMFFNSKNP